METTTPQLLSFAQDVLEGLSAQEKFIPSKYFYDKKGDRLFQKIMGLPEYYLTRKEFEILDQYKGQILEPMIQTGRKFNLVELGAGDGLKTKILIKYLYQKKVRFNYFPIDISGNALNDLAKDLKQEFPGLPVHPLENSYKEALHLKSWKDECPTLMLFLGANLGNFNRQGVMEMLGMVSGGLGIGDHLLLGFDLKKDPDLILRAYHDRQGVTRDFNLNVLDRINRELGGDFNLDKFKHWPVYNPVTGECKSYLVALEAHDVNIKSLHKKIQFKKAETIHTEISRKFDLEEISDLSHQYDFEMLNNFLDDQEYFADSLWKKR